MIRPLKPIVNCFETISNILNDYFALVNDLISFGKTNEKWSPEPT